MPMNSICHDLRSALHLISHANSARDVLHGACAIAVQERHFSSARIGRCEGASAQVTWVAEVDEARDGHRIEAARIVIVSNGEPWGILSAFCTPDVQCSTEDVEFLKDICLVIGLAMESRRLCKADRPPRRESPLVAVATSLARQHSLHTQETKEGSPLDLLAAVAHELRSPLTSVIGFTGMMLQQIPGPLNAEQQRQLQMIRTSGRRLLDLIKDIIDLSKVALGQTRPRMRPFDLNDTVRSTTIRLEPMSATQGNTLRYELPRSPTLCVSDPQIIEQLITELVDNALKFTERGQVKVTVRTLRAHRSGDSRLDVTDYACLEISDTGIGIPPSAMPRLFTPFGHAGHGKTHRHEGSRLGLALCKGLIDLLHGHIHVESRPNSGSTFTVHLPLQWHSGVP